MTGNYPNLWVGETQTLSRLSLIVLSLRFRPGFDWDSSFCSIWLTLPIFLQMLCWVSPSQLNQAQNQTETWIYFKNPVAGMEQHTALFTGQPGDFLHPGLFFFYFFLNPEGLGFFFSCRIDCSHCFFQIDSWCKENSYVIAGYYQANERVKDARCVGPIFPSVCSFSSYLGLCQQQSFPINH